MASGRHYAGSRGFRLRDECSSLCVKSWFSASRRAVVILPEVVVYDFETSGLLVPIQLPESYPWVTIQEEDPPGPIPNPAVKLLLAYGSMGETPCESRYRPGFYSSERRHILCLRFLLPVSAGPWERRTLVRLGF